MGDHRGSVIALPGATGPGCDWPVHGGLPHEPVRQLDELTLALRRFHPQLSWSPPQWAIASTESRMRISILREALRDLVGASPVSEQHAIRWALELDGVRREIERWSDELTAQVQALQCADLPFAERRRELDRFLAGRRELAHVLDSARDLISRRFALALDQGS